MALVSTAGKSHTSFVLLRRNYHFSDHRKPCQSHFHADFAENFYVFNRIAQQTGTMLASRHACHQHPTQVVFFSSLFAQGAFLASSWYRLTWALGLRIRSAFREIPIRVGIWRRAWCRGTGVAHRLCALAVSTIAPEGIGKAAVITQQRLSHGRQSNGVATGPRDKPAAQGDPKRRCP